MQLNKFNAKLTGQEMIEKLQDEGIRIIIGPVFY